MPGGVDRGRVAYERRASTEAFNAISSVAESDRNAGGLERLAVAAYLIGNDDDSAAAWEVAHRRDLSSGDPAEAARCGFWLAFSLMMRGHVAQANGRLARTETTIAGLDCAAAGYLLIPGLLAALGSR